MAQFRPNVAEKVSRIWLPMSSTWSGRCACFPRTKCRHGMVFSLVWQRGHVVSWVRFCRCVGARLAASLVVQLHVGIRHEPRRKMHLTTTQRWPERPRTQAKITKNWPETSNNAAPATAAATSGSNAAADAATAAATTQNREGNDHNRKRIEREEEMRQWKERERGGEDERRGERGEVLKI